LHEVNGGEHEEIILQVATQTKALLEKTHAEIPWCGYLAADAETRTVVGTCAFKDQPSPEGIVEIAYFTFPAFERQGYGTTAARMLIEIALASRRVQKVIAHTLPERNASTRILEKVGMTCQGEAHDPEDGLVWRWECERKD
jgi:RimJ/RimL family protein N-acetyltransferase